MTAETPKYTAALSQSQGRAGYTAIFRHPVLLDARGRPGRRVRKGLGTRDRPDAEAVLSDLNTLLGDASFWDPSTRGLAEQRFDPRAVSIFYAGLTPERVDFAATRDDLLPLPSSADSAYRRLLLLGTTGAGKTTLARQLIGTGERERFPSTSTAKTTIADTEILLDAGPYRAAVTFFPRDHVRDHVEECVSHAVLGAYRGESDREVLGRLLMHVEQRFRFNYVLGIPPEFAIVTTDEEEDDDEVEVASDDALTDISELSSDTLAETHEVLRRAVRSVRALADEVGSTLWDELAPQSEEDERVVQELFEEELDALVRDHDSFLSTADDLMEEIERRFETLADGDLLRSRQGWPTSWSFESEDRAVFLRSVMRFTSNYAPWFGHLLTPLVNGIRVAGPFTPTWADSQPPLVIFDVEGLGHTNDSATALSSALTRKLNDVDAIVLVDNAAQPLQAAPVAAIKALTTSGNLSKLLVVFTHFDAVRGDNLPTASAKEQHVLASVEQVISSLTPEIGNSAAQTLRTRMLESARFFVSSIDQPIDDATKRGRRTARQLLALLEGVAATGQPRALAVSRPIYDQMNLAMAIRGAAEVFQMRWNARLGLVANSRIPKKHWAQIKALTRRLAVLDEDQYGQLMPVSELAGQLRDHIYLLIQQPVRWSNGEPPQDAQQAIFDEFADQVSRRMLELASRRVWDERLAQWRSAYALRGPGSTFVRARTLADDVYDRAAPVPDLTPAPDRNRFLHEVIDEVRDVAEQLEIGLR